MYRGAFPYHSYRGSMISMTKRFLKSNWFVFALYLILYLLIFSAYTKGIGQFWDWSWPLFNSQLKNIFSIESLSWVSSGLGKPLAYSSNYWSRLILSSTGYLGISSETILYFLIVIMATVSSYLLYLISRVKSDRIFSTILGLIAVLNPAILYKLVSGHMGFIIAYPIFLGFIYFLIVKFKKDLKSYIILGLLLAFVGVQIQFFVFALLAVVLFMIFMRQLFSFKYSLVSAVIAFLINLPWLSNLIAGAGSISGYSGQAASVSFDGAMTAKIRNIIVLAFSEATTIKYYFSRPEFLFFGIFTLVVMVLAVRYLKNKDLKESEYLVALWIIFLFFTTGAFHYIKVFPFSIFNPMFREVGHFAPMVVLFGLLIIANIKIQNKYFCYPLLGYLIIFAVISGYAIATKLPKLNYASAREKFQSFKTFTENDQSEYRILSYPFFGQYSYFDQSKKDVRGRLIENSGTDNFLELSGRDIISNYIQPPEIKESEQFKIVQSYDISGLKNKNVKYIYDFSNIWESNFERYSGSGIYNNDLSLIKNDPQFYEKLMAKNPEGIKQVSDRIYEIVDTKPRIYSDGDAKVEFEKIDATKYKIRISNLKSSQNLNFLENYHGGWKIFPKKLLANSYQLSASLFDDTHRTTLDYANSWTLDPDEIKSKLNEDQYQINDDGSIDIDLILYFKPQDDFVIARAVAVLTIIISLGLLVWLSHFRQTSLQKYK